MVYLNDGWKMPDTNLVDTEIGVFLLVEKYINDGFYAQIQLYRDWILMRLWRQPEGVFIVIIEFLYSYTLMLFSRKFTWKEWIKIVLITKQEAMILNRKYKIPFGEDGISHTYTKSRKYYICENKYNINALENIRKIQTVG